MKYEQGKVVLSDTGPEEQAVESAKKFISEKGWTQGDVKIIRNNGAIEVVTKRDLYDKIIGRIIRIVDLETTGFEPEDGEVCEIASVDLDIKTGEISNKRQSLVKPDNPIPPITSAVHHLIDEDVKDADKWETLKPQFITDDEDIAAYAAHTAKFEKQWCESEKPWICTYKGALRVWRDAPSHSNQALRYWRNPQGLVREESLPAHRALPDAYVTAFHMRDLLEHASIEELVDWSDKPALQVTCHIGTWRGSPWTEVDLGFLHWVSDRDFDEDVLYTVNHEINRRTEVENAEYRGVG